MNKTIFVNKSLDNFLQHFEAFTYTNTIIRSVIQ